MSTFLGVDGGGSKTAFLLIDDTGHVLARLEEGPAYHFETGFDALRAMLARAVERALAQAGLAAGELSFAFFGLPAYGEDSRLLPELDGIATPTLPRERYRCGNDALCGWAGGLAGADGIHLICGTGSMAYGQFEGRAARAGGWGELFGDEGSAYWIAAQGLNLFSRMSDGRMPHGPLYGLLRDHFSLGPDLDLCAAIYGDGQSARSRIAALAPLIARAAEAGDEAARRLFHQAAAELAQMTLAVRSQLAVPVAHRMPVSYSGGLFRQRELLLAPLRETLSKSTLRFELHPPILSPAAGAALHAARLCGQPLGNSALQTLAAETA